MKRRKLVLAGMCSFLLLASSVVSHAQTDPGPRSGPAGAGSFYPGLNANEQAFFGEAQEDFMEVDSVQGTLTDEGGKGLGPTFNGSGCAQCHAQPAVGGSSPGLKSPQNPVPNPQVALATAHGATNTVPSFITEDGPVREARFIRNRDGSPDGGVHGLFTITGRTDAPGCNLAQPDFAGALARNNVIFRIPTPTFGLGLVEGTPDSVLQDNLNANSRTKSRLGISGRLNTSGNDGTVTRLGWKAQNKSLVIFAGEAYNVEQGVSNEGFTNERSAVAGCVFNGGPEDATNLDETSGSAAGMSGDLINFAAFMRLTAPPTPADPTSSTQNGALVFGSIGCVLCHSDTLTTGKSRFTGMSDTVYHPYSDFALHNMGPDLADGISQGGAAGDEFRTAPLWGLGQRLFFLHDGRTSDLVEAIKEHSSDCGHSRHRSWFQSRCNSEADGVVRNFNALSKTQAQDLLNFLRSL